MEHIDQISQDYGKHLDNLERAQTLIRREAIATGRGRVSHPVRFFLQNSLIHGIVHSQLETWAKIRAELIHCHSHRIHKSMSIKYNNSFLQSQRTIIHSITRQAQPSAMKHKTNCPLFYSVFITCTVQLRIGRASEPPVGRPSEVKPATNKILCQLGKEAMLVQKGIASTPCSV